MTQAQIERLANSGNFPDGSRETELVETHASWVVLTKEFAFKIKKPVRFSFLNFSTLELRKQACEDELRLNRRLTDIYLSVVPIAFDGRQWGIGIEGEVLDYAVKMKRIDSSRQMDLLLEKGLVSLKDIEELTAIIARFHKNTAIIYRQFDPVEMQEDFGDLASVIPTLSEHIDEKFRNLISGWIELSGCAIEQLSRRFTRREREGFVRDGHGDLHCRNIFLSGKPIIFDCIEFNERLRINDVLSELAFLAMDLDRFGRSDFKDFLIKKYREEFDCFPQPEDFIIFQYYLLYRVTIRLKIAGLSLKEEMAEPTTDPEIIKRDIRALAGLSHQYASQLKGMLKIR